MATISHPETGVLLNVVDVVRPSLNHDEAITVHVMRKRGSGFQEIAQKLGTNPARVGEVLRGDQHYGTEALALKIIEKQEPPLPF